MKNLDIITDPHMAWLPWTIFASVLVIGAVIGFINGWRTATYFLGWNLVFLIAGVLLFDAFYGEMVNWAKGFMGKSSGSGPNLGQALEDSKGLIKPILGVIFMIPVLLVGNFLAFLMYWFFRGNLKRRMKDNRQAQLSNKGVRFVGAGVGVITAFPITVFATTASTMLSPDDEFNKITDFMSSGMSFTKFAGTADSIDATRDALRMAQDPDALTELGKAFTGGTVDSNKLNKKSIANIQNALNNKKLLPVIAKTAQNLMGTNGPKSVNDLKKLATDVKSSLNGKNPLFTINNQASEDKILDMMKNFIKSKTTNKPFSRPQYKTFLEDSGLFKFN